MLSSLHTETSSHRQSSGVESQDPKDQLIFKLMSENLLLEQQFVQLSEQKAELERDFKHLEGAYDSMYDDLMKMMRGLHQFHRGVMEALPRYWTARSLKRRLRELADTHLKAQQPPGGAH